MLPEDVATHPSRLVRQSLHAELLVRLRAMIVAGQLRPGEKIPELALSKQFGVSRTPLRESLKALAAEGLVSLLPNRGAIVSVITEAEIDELFPIIGSLEALAGELACRNASSGDLARFDALHQAILDSFRDGAETTYLAANRQFHELLFEIAANASLTDLYHSLLVRIHSARFIFGKDRADWQSAVDDHKEIIVALQRRNAPLLAGLLKRHLSETAARASHHFLQRRKNPASAA